MGEPATSAPLEAVLKLPLPRPAQPGLQELPRHLPQAEREAAGGTRPPPPGTGSGLGQRPRIWVTSPVPQPQGSATDGTVRQKQSKHKPSLKAWAPCSGLRVLPYPQQFRANSRKEGGKKITKS